MKQYREKSHDFGEVTVLKDVIIIMKIIIKYGIEIIVIMIDNQCNVFWHSK